MCQYRRPHVLLRWTKPCTIVQTNTPGRKSASSTGKHPAMHSNQTFIQFQEWEKRKFNFALAHLFHSFPKLPAVKNKPSTFSSTSNPINLSIHFPRTQHNIPPTLYSFFPFKIPSTHSTAPLTPLFAFIRRDSFPIDLRHRLDAIRRHEGIQRPLRRLGCRLGRAVLVQRAVQLVCPSAVGLGARAEGDVRGVGGVHGAEAGFGGGLGVPFLNLCVVLVWGLDVCLLEGWSWFAGGYGGLGGGSASDLFVG